MNRQETREYFGKTFTTNEIYYALNRPLDILLDQAAEFSNNKMVADVFLQARTDLLGKQKKRQADLPIRLGGKL